MVVSPSWDVCTIIFVWRIENASVSNYDFVIDLRDDADVNAIEFRVACDDTYCFEYTYVRLLIYDLNSY